MIDLSGEADGRKPILLKKNAKNPMNFWFMRECLRNCSCRSATRRVKYEWINISGSKVGTMDVPPPPPPFSPISFIFVQFLAIVFCQIIGWQVCPSWVGAAPSGKFWIPSVSVQSRIFNDQLVWQFRLLASLNYLVFWTLSALVV